MLPVGQAPVTSPFGWREHPVLKTRRFHNGVDFGVPPGTAVGAWRPGVVVAAKPWPDTPEGRAKQPNGTYAKILHEDGFVSFYLHLSSLAVDRGERVAMGQIVGRSGATGRVQVHGDGTLAAHLHFEVHDPENVPVDPASWVSPDAAPVRVA